MAIYISDTKPTSGNFKEFSELDWSTKATQCMVLKLATGCDDLAGDSGTLFTSVREWLKKFHDPASKADAVMPVDVLGWASDRLQSVASLPPT